MLRDGPTLPKMDPRYLAMAQVALRCSQDDPKMAPRRPKMAARWLPDGPGEPQEGSPREGLGMALGRPPIRDERGSERGGARWCSREERARAILTAL